jgi:hypothetical protein
VRQTLTIYDGSLNKGSADNTAAGNTIAYRGSLRSVLQLTLNRQLQLSARVLAAHARCVYEKGRGEINSGD